MKNPSHMIGAYAGKPAVARPNAVARAIALGSIDAGEPETMHLGAWCAMLGCLALCGIAGYAFAAIALAAI
jgi:hypothetical protein